jgi:polyphosphate kinase
MNRNLDRRIELLFEVEDPEIRQQVLDILKVCLQTH